MTQASERPRRKRLSWESRCEVVARIEAGVSPPLAAAGGGCSRATAYRLWRRYRAGGWAALQDRPSTPRRQPRRLSPELEERIVVTRRRTAYGPVRLAGLVPHPPSTIGKVLRRHGCSRLPRPGAAAARCAIDDHSRLAYAELIPRRDADSCARFLARAVAWYAEQGIAVERVLTDNAKAYHARVWVETAHELGIECRHTRIYRPRTNGKAERFIQTLLAEWAYARSYPSSVMRARALGGYLRWYNRRRPHSSLGARPPISRVSHLRGQDS